MQPRYFSRWIIVLPCLTTVTDISMTGPLKMAKQNWTKYREGCGKILRPFIPSMCPKMADKTWKHIHVKSRPTWSRDSWWWIYATFFATSCHPTKCIYADWAVVGQMYRSPSQMYCLYKCTDAPSRAKWITCSATLLTLQTCNEPNSTGVEQSLADYIIQAFFADEWSRDRLARFALHFIFCFQSSCPLRIIIKY